MMDIKEFEERIKEIRKIIREIKKLARILKAKSVEVRVSLPSLDMNFFIVLAYEQIVFKKGIVIDIDFDEQRMIFKAFGLKYTYYNKLKYDPEKIVSVGEKYKEKFENDDGRRMEVE